MLMNCHCLGLSRHLALKKHAAIWLSVGLSAIVTFRAEAATNLPAYYAHDTVLDEHGVIAPWYRGLNGQSDERLNIAVSVYKRYPWVDKPKAVMAAPDFIYNSHWSIKPDGTILTPETSDRLHGEERRHLEGARCRQTFPERANAAHLVAE